VGEGSVSMVCCSVPILSCSAGLGVDVEVGRTGVRGGELLLVIPV
jgi:hypothetical protein